MNVVRYGDAPERLWRNGRGVTRELHIGQGWRLSVATIAQAGAFSAFPGLDRVFVVAGGTVELDVDGFAQTLRIGEEARFPGEAVVSAVPGGDPAFAVNTMITRATHRADVRVARLNGRMAEADARNAEVLVLLEGVVTVLAEAEAVSGPELAMVPGSPVMSASPAVLAPFDALVLARDRRGAPNHAVHCFDALVVLITVAAVAEASADETRSPEGTP